MAFVGKKTPDAADFYDKVENAYDEMHFKKRKGAKHACGVDIDAIIPSESEVRLLGNRHRQCAYYQIGKSTFSLISLQEWTSAIPKC
jgi:hypothetical protein